MFHTYEWRKILEVLLQLVKSSHKLKHDDLGFMYKEYNKLSSTNNFIIIPTVKTNFFSSNLRYAYTNAKDLGATKMFRYDDTKGLVVKILS